MKHITTIFTLVFVLILSGCVQKETFEGIKCEKSSCLDEKQGYYWAKKNKITHSTKCDFGFSKPFIQGCSRFIEQKNTIGNEQIVTQKKQEEKQDEETENRKDNVAEEQWITVKYRTSGSVNVLSGYFEEITNRDTTVKNAWYDKDNLFMLIQLQRTVYQYCNVPESVWNDISSSSSPSVKYKALIKGNFDCRDFGEIVY